MKQLTFYGDGLPGLAGEPSNGHLIVVEGPDGVGRTTQVAMLKAWLESSGYAVADTGMLRSALAGPGIKQAKAGHSLGRMTMSLFYATDFADRLESQIVPALRAGFVVLADRYIYSALARAIVRGVDREWIRAVYGMALVPDHVFYLRPSSVDILVQRNLMRGGLDFWESGMDLHLGDNLYDSFVIYQTRLMQHFEELTQLYHFEVVNADAPPEKLFAQMKNRVAAALDAAQ